MGYRFKPSKAKAREFAEKMDVVRDFCVIHNISHSLSMDSFYFCLRGQSYRVSNHTIEASNRAAFNDLGQTRELYHSARDADTIYIHASKTRIIEIYENLAAGHAIDGRGNVQEAQKNEEF